MGDISDARADLKTALEATGYVVYAYPAENMTTPCIVLVPGSPYIEIKSIGSSPRLGGNFDVTLCVAANDNQAALVNLETMIETVLGAIPTGVGIGDFSQPKISQVGPTDLLTTDITIDVTI
jgi:hypothetical protein